MGGKETTPTNHHEAVGGVSRLEKKKKMSRFKTSKYRNAFSRAFKKEVLTNAHSH